MPSADPEVAQTETSVPLDEVMLAMDVVDTLRHQQQLVAQELDADKRRRKLVARVKAIYESQGMEVSDAVIAEGVKALEQDRFTYDPPERTLAVRLAEIYIDRVKWAIGGLIAAGIVVAIWLALTIPPRLKRQSLIEGFRTDITAMTQQVGDLAARRERLARDVATADAGGSAVVADILADAKTKLAGAQDGLEAVQAALRPGPDPELYPEDRARLDAVVDGHRKTIQRVTAELGAVHGQLQVVTKHESARTEIGRLVKRIAGMSLDAPTRAEVDELLASARTALDSGNEGAARRDLAQLGNLITQLEQTYELRIVSRAGKRAGVWRHANNRRDSRNYYIIVEAIAANGKRLRLRVTNEENQRTSHVSTFGVRVPQEVYEAVKADKLDNGIIDKRIFGVKKRGARAAEYRFPVAGGMITRW